jgi:hypothetical protein
MLALLLLLVLLVLVLLLLQFFSALQSYTLELQVLGFFQLSLCANDSRVCRAV